MLAELVDFSPGLYVASCVDGVSSYDVMIVGAEM